MSHAPQRSLYIDADASYLHFPGPLIQPGFNPAPPNLPLISPIRAPGHASPSGFPAPPNRFYPIPRPFVPAAPYLHGNPGPFHPFPLPHPAQQWSPTRSLNRSHCSGYSASLSPPFVRRLESVEPRTLASSVSSQPLASSTSSSTAFTRGLSPAPSLASSAPSEWPPKKEHVYKGPRVLVLLPVEYRLQESLLDNDAIDGPIRPRSLWLRTFTIEKPSLMSNLDDEQCEVITRQRHPDEIKCLALPPTIEVYLPGLIGWEDYLGRLKLEKLTSSTAHIDDVVRRPIFIRIITKSVGRLQRSRLK